MQQLLVCVCVEIKETDEENETEAKWRYIAAQF